MARELLEGAGWDIPYNRVEVERLKVDMSGVEEAVSSLGIEHPLRRTRIRERLSGDGGSDGLLSEFTDYLHALCRRPVLVGTHHTGSTIPLLEKAGVRYTGYVTPVNPREALMLPSQNPAIEAINSVREKVFATKPLPGGRMPLHDAFEYVFSEIGVAASMVGATSLEELTEEVHGARRALLGYAKHT